MKTEYHNSVGCNNTFLLNVNQKMEDSTNLILSIIAKKLAGQQIPNTHQNKVL